MRAVHLVCSGRAINEGRNHALLQLPELQMSLRLGGTGEMPALRNKAFCHLKGM